MNSCEKSPNRWNINEAGQLDDEDYCLGCSQIGMLTLEIKENIIHVMMKYNMLKQICIDVVAIKVALNYMTNEFLAVIHWIFKVLI